MTLSFHLACNDHRNGEFAGRFEVAAVYRGAESLLTLEGDGLRCRFVTSPEGKERIPHLKVYGLGRFPYRRHASMVGNWCWDALTMEAEVLARLLNRLRQFHWTCTEAIQPFFDLWEKPWGEEVFTPSVLLEESKRD